LFTYSTIYYFFNYLNFRFNIDFHTFYAESEDKYFDIKGYNILLLSIVFIIPDINAICIKYDLVNRLYDLNFEFENHPGRVYNKNKFVNNILNFLLNSLQNNIGSLSNMLDEPIILLYIQIVKTVIFICIKVY
jgi:hypothetical protein